jgi:hypothetical protein
MHESTDSIHLIRPRDPGILPLLQLGGGWPLKKVGNWGKSAKPMNGQG